MNDILNRLQGQFIVSCQAEGDDPFNTPEYVALFAKAAVIGGAKGIRSEGLEKIKCIKSSVQVPVIGLLKSSFDDGFVKITGSFKEVEELIQVGCDIIAIDGTDRLREGMTGPDFIKEVKLKYSCCVLADIATKNEALAAESAGADCISTTLSGYTPETLSDSLEPDYTLVRELVGLLKIPLFAEGRINTPDQAKEMMLLGAYGVISGTAITRPRVITKWFVNAIQS